MYRVTIHEILPPDAKGYESAREVLDARLERLDLKAVVRVLYDLPINRPED